MDFIWTSLRIPVENDDLLTVTMARKLKVPEAMIQGLRFLRRSLDARKKPHLVFDYTVQFSLGIPKKEGSRLLSRIPGLKEAPPEVPVVWSKPCKKLKHRPVVVGSGPAGYFAALALARRGYRPIVLERGDSVEERTRKVQEFWQTGRLDTESNVQFGEGGAGTFSDGKLTTRIQDRRITEVLETFVKHGAPPEILFLAKPHIGTDILKDVVRGIRQEIISLGGEVRFRAKVTALKSLSGQIQSVTVNGQVEIPVEAIVLAVGHSARDVYGFLHDREIALERKGFAIGLRIEHPQAMVNLAQYGVEEHPLVGPADYQLTFKDSMTGRGAYAFCMCPGGKVVAAASEEGGVVTNGMSEYSRDTNYANSAIVVTIGTDDFATPHLLAGLEFQRTWERKAFAAGGFSYRAPAQRVQDFLAGRVSDNFDLPASYLPGIVPYDLHGVLPQEVGDVLGRALQAFDGKIHGFTGPRATLTGIESRTSSPLRIVRNERGESISIAGLYPAGEGAGYAGGITSAAVDGLRMAEHLMAQYAMVE
ncbi:FAD-dependent dehydrogenase [Desulfosporosinus acidiphilus SJ4]|uniref:FAD-dependent dehydrogenase n=1 Tax=Desulfosporosinus acidiphilus (strain DSM 22704 / JCM 16185 / SJ4) TaxID=646529 RepID=I4D1M4_DESAJ|nr:FAD-dependent oxidoreductase [Desulfosporosinus acidiphilus]AFM39698.1 FAD-dependent dehydrogenase [Desulfosporosinus acidiphilus SJ4]